MADRIEEIKQYVATMRALKSDSGSVDKLEYLLAALAERDKELQAWKDSRDGVLEQLREYSERAEQAEARVKELETKVTQAYLCLVERWRAVLKDALRKEE